MSTNIPNVKIAQQANTAHKATPPNQPDAVKPFFITIDHKTSDSSENKFNYRLALLIQFPFRY